MRLQLMLERLKESLRQYERELMQQREKERQLNNKNKLISTKLKAEKDEVGGALAWCRQLSTALIRSLYRFDRQFGLVPQYKRGMFHCIVANSSFSSSS